MLSKTKVDGKSTLETRSWLMINDLIMMIDDVKIILMIILKLIDVNHMNNGQLIIQGWWQHTMHIARSLRFFIISFASFIRLVEGGGRRGGLLDTNMFVILFQLSSLWSISRLCFDHCYLHLFCLFNLRHCFNYLHHYLYFSMPNILIIIVSLALSW